MICSTDTKKKLAYLTTQIDEWIKADLSDGTADLWYIVPIFKRAVGLGEFALLLEMRLKLDTEHEQISIEVNKIKYELEGRAIFVRTNKGAF